jgi:hypothetical protein
MAALTATDGVYGRMDVCGAGGEKDSVDDSGKDAWAMVGRLGASDAPTSSWKREWQKLENGTPS